MNEAYLRTWHRRMGIMLALFIFLQAASGLALNSETLVGIAGIAPWASFLHRGGGEFGTFDRSLLGLGLAGMAISGSLIYYRIWRRSQNN